MSVLDFQKAVSKIHQNILNLISDGFHTFDDNATQEEKDKFRQDLDNVFKSSSQDARNEALAQAKEASTKHLLDRGYSRADIERRFNPLWEKIKNAAEEARVTSPEVKKAAQSVWLKLVGFVGAIAALAAGTGIYAFFNSGPTPEEQAALDIIHRSQLQRMQIEHLSEIMISADEFQIMIAGLTISSAPMPTQTPLPLRVEAVAAAPVHVTVITPTGRQEFTTDIGEVYRNSPEPVQHRIEQTVSSPIEQTVPSPDEQTASRPERSFHKTFTVSGTPFGSATFSY